MSTDATTLGPRWIDAEWPRYLDAPVEIPRTRAAVFMALGVGVLFDLAVRSGVVGVGGTLCIAVACWSLVLTGRVRNSHGQVLVAIAPIFGLCLSIRASSWLFPLNIFAVCALVSVGVSLSSGGSVWHLSIPAAAGRAMQSVAQLFLAPTYLLGGSPRATGRTAGIARGVVLALPIVIVLIVLFASADAVFASFVRFDASDLILHTVLIVGGTLAMTWLIRLASLSYVEVPTVTRPRVGSTETTVILAALNVLLGAFAVARLISLSEGGQRVIKSAGLTYAEYARSGFFQLLGAAAIVVATLLVLRATAEVEGDTQRRTFVGLSLAVVVLTLAIVVSAFHRLVLYEGAFGLTLLRIYVQAAIVWIGIVVILLGVAVARSEERPTWLAPASGLAALVLLLAMNVFNPEAFIARHNLEHQATTGQSDPSYVFELGDDAVPVLLENEKLRPIVCGQRPTTWRGWAAFNVAHERASNARSEICPQEGG